MNSFYQPDWLGSTRTVTGSTGSTVAALSYEAWGSRDQVAQGSPNWPTDLQFAGAWGYQTEDSNLPNEPGLGLDYLQQRYYDPVVGRFMEPDPLGYAAGTNLFEYAEDDPANGVDPTGENLRKDLGNDGWKVLQDALKRGWHYEEVPGAPHPHTVWRTNSNGGVERVPIPSKHGSGWGKGLKARVNRELREAEAKACPTDADLLELAYETIFDEREVISEAVLEGCRPRSRRSPRRSRRTASSRTRAWTCSSSRF